MKKRLLVCLTVGGSVMTISFLWMTRSTTSEPAASSIEHETKNLFAAATAVPAATPTRESFPDRARRLFEAIEATNVPIAFWGKVVDQDGGPIGGVNINYDYSIEHGHPSGVAGEQERRTGNVVTDADGLFAIQGLRGHDLAILTLTKSGFQFRSKGALIFDFYGSTSSGRFVPNQHRPVAFTMVEKHRMEPLVHLKGSLRVGGDGVPERWSLWQGEADPSGELMVTLSREPAVLERPGQAALWSAKLQIVGGGIMEAPWDENVRRAPESGYVETIPYPKAEQKQGVPFRSFYVKTADGRFGRLQVDLDAYSQGATARCAITGDMNPRPGSRNLEPVEED